MVSFKSLNLSQPKVLVQSGDIHWGATRLMKENPEGQLKGGLTSVVSKNTNANHIDKSLISWQTSYNFHTLTLTKYHRVLNIKQK